MVVPPAPDGRSALTTAEPEPASPDAPEVVDDLESPRRSDLFRVVLLGVLVVLLLLSATALVLLLLGRRGEAGDVQRNRDAASSQARQFMLRLNTYGPDQLDDKGAMPDYRSSVSGVITPKFEADFEKNVTTAEATVSQAGIGRTAAVYAAGVSAIDSDSATALVAGSFTQSVPKTPGSDKRVETPPAPFRVEVKLVKTDGTWLVDDFTPLTGAGSDQSSSGQTTPGQTIPSQVTP